MQVLRPSTPSVSSISFQWLVASSPRIETEVKSLIRKCAQVRSGEGRSDEAGHWE